MERRLARTCKLTLRPSTQARTTLVAAAKAERCSLSDFILASALERADEILAGRRHFSLDAARWSEFQKALDAPPRDLPELKKLLNEPGRFIS